MLQNVAKMAPKCLPGAGDLILQKQWFYLHESMLFETCAIMEREARKAASVGRTARATRVGQSSKHCKTHKSRPEQQARQDAQEQAERQEQQTGPEQQEQHEQQDSRLAWGFARALRALAQRSKGKQSAARGVLLVTRAARLERRE